jgi:hypothetical protein
MLFDAVQLEDNRVRNAHCAWRLASRGVVSFEAAITSYSP